MAAGQYTSAVTVGTADQNQDVLSSREVRVTYELLVGHDGDSHAARHLSS